MRRRRIGRVAGELHGKGLGEGQGRRRPPHALVRAAGPGEVGPREENTAAGRGGLDLLVWERGVGLTQACGTGSCAAAAAARAAGLVSSRVEVHNPGGTLVVELHGEDPLAPSVFLSGRASRVFRVELGPSEIDALA